MARGHVDLPAKAAEVVLRKSDIFGMLERIDTDAGARKRVLDMETAFRTKISTHLKGLPEKDAKLRKFNTSPFVLMFYARQQGYKTVAQIEKAIVPAKVFSSMETSAGRMIEEVVLPIYGWQVVPSGMHSAESVLDGRKTDVSGTLLCATLKSGPRCLNDEMAKDIGVDVVSHCCTWAATHAVSEIDFTYGVLYGTKRQSNKKDWHVLRSFAEALDASDVISRTHRKQWEVAACRGGVAISATVRIGIEWWTYLGGETAWLELCIALIRACVDPQPVAPGSPAYLIKDLKQVLDISSKPDGFNIALLQESQLEWVMFLAHHFCDSLV